jgi:hypothetical protein
MNASFPSTSFDFCPVTPDEATAAVVGDAAVVGLIVISLFLTFVARIA